MNALFACCLFDTSTVVGFHVGTMGIIRFMQKEFKKKKKDVDKGGGVWYYK